MEPCRHNNYHCIKFPTLIPCNLSPNRGCGSEGISWERDTGMSVLGIARLVITYSATA